MAEPAIRYAAQAPRVVSELVEDLWAGADVDQELVVAMRSALVTSPDAAVPSNVACAPKRLPLLLLPGLSCQAAGGDRRQAARVAAAWGLLYVAAALLDNAEDGNHHVTSLPLRPGAAINLAVGLMSSAGLALDQLTDALIDAELGDAIRRDFHRTVLRMCAGQHARLTRLEPTLEECWRQAEARSGSFFALACRSGARLATADPARWEALAEFGAHLGILIQIQDDLRDLWSRENHPGDLAGGRGWTLPVAYAMAVLPAAPHQRLHESLRAALCDAEAEAAARRQIIESGAVLYLAVEAERRRRRAEARLTAGLPPCAARDELLALLAEAASLSTVSPAVARHGNPPPPPVG